MANKKAYLVALGKADSPEFKALDDLPPTVEVMSVNLIDQVLGMFFLVFMSFLVCMAPAGALQC